MHGCFSRFLNCTNGTKSRKSLTLTLTFLRLTKWSIAGPAYNDQRLVFLEIFGDLIYFLFQDEFGA